MELLARVSALVAACPVAFLLAQSSQSSFDVASIKLVEECQMPGPAIPVAGEFVLPCAPTEGIIVTAYVSYATGSRYDVDKVPIEGLPDWARKDLYTIRAKAEGNPSQAVMSGPMLRSLLAERFQLRIHEETRLMPVYQLTLARGGSKLPAHREGSCLAWQPGMALPEGRRFCNTRMSQQSPSVFTLDLEGVDMTALAKRLGTILDRPVIDKTNLSGVFDVELNFGADDRTPTLIRLGQPNEPSGATGLSTALQEQLGLRLEAIRGPGRFLVIDHIERPTEN